MTSIESRAALQRAARVTKQDAAARASVHEAIETAHAAQTARKLRELHSRMAAAVAEIKQCAAEVAALEESDSEITRRQVLDVGYSVRVERQCDSGLVSR
jgi:hypothetical protein